MNQKNFLGVLWLGFIVYAFFLAPPTQPDTFELIQKISLGEWQGINPLIISLFNLMGRNVESLNKTLHIGAQGSLTAVN